MGDCVSREEEPVAAGGNGPDDGGAVKRRLSRGKLTDSGRHGDIVAADPHDKEHTYKIEFNDGQLPAVDWVRGDKVELVGASFSIELQGQHSDEGTRLVVKPNDTIADLYSKAEQELNFEHGSLHLSVGQDNEAKVALDDRLGALDIVQGTKVEYFEVDKFNTSLIRVETKSHSCGAGETQTVVAAVYGQKGTQDQTLLWATESLTKGGDSGVPDAKLSSDNCELLLTYPGSDTRRYPVASLVFVARKKEKTSLEDQFKAKFGEQRWPGYTGRVCRQIS